METLLADYEAAPDKRDPRAVHLEDGRIGYVEPIYIKPVCLACHGEISGELADMLATLYPEDQATGFAPDEFRGMFWLKMPADARANVAE